MPRPPSPLPDELGDAFTRADGLAAGVTARRLRAKDLESPFHGVRQRPVAEPRRAAASARQPQWAAEATRTGEGSRATEARRTGEAQRAAEAARAGEGTHGDAVESSPPLAVDRMTRKAVLRRARAYREVMAEQAFFVGRSAAVAYGLPIAHSGELEVGVRAPATAPRGRGIRGIKVQPAFVHVRDHEGLRMSSPASTWAMLGRELSVRELVIVGDAVVRIPRDDRGRPQPDEQLATIAQLQRAVQAGPRRGVERLREALVHIRVGSSSPLETEYRLDAATAGLPEPELDVAIRDRHGALLGVTEVVYREQRTLVEIEGDHHRTDKRQWDRDIEKYAAYVAEGWEVVRLTARHIRGRHPRAAGMVGDVLARRAQRP
ncbi:hypothetical protein [Microbacterium ulmi]|uniref:DUF559 domain-containing protein n=1 Tax=Microbacterium ulmi TaxID=179095 RepID=A0A7Y2M320_9MICO|nr:hypothetical protein [Microbacterium ulmi]NII68885.1 hypothetical protein [Microbacterium ulmi]NNH05119.1 hypothetical protein [Microbacterium ulmi]